MHKLTSLYQKLNHNAVAAGLLALDLLWLAADKTGHATIAQRMMLLLLVLVPLLVTWSIAASNTKVNDSLTMTMAGITASALLIASENRWHWVSFPILAGMGIAAAIGMSLPLFFLMRDARQAEVSRHTFLQQLLQDPALAFRVWYVQEDYNAMVQIRLFAQTAKGKVHLANPGEAAKTWSLLQSAGILVHDSPPAA